ncbi:MAG: hypothetical protein AAFX00_07550, partial [Pseudomonadota bacterium]
MSNDQFRMYPHVSYIPYATTTIRRPTKAFCFAPLYPKINSETGLPKSDAREFQACATKFCSVHNLSDPYFFDNDGDDAVDVIDVPNRRSPWRGRTDDSVHLEDRREEILQALSRAEGPLDFIGYFGHGGKHSLSSAGFRQNDRRGASFERLVSVIAGKVERRFVISLFACRCGERGGIAEALYHALSARGL